MISIIVAIDEKNAIGHNGGLLCHMSADLKHFKALTTGHPVIMGRKTFDSLPNGALPNRTNIVVTRQESLSYPNVVISHSLQEALAGVPADEEAFVIGGASMYEESISFADRLYLTQIHHTFDEADTYFPTWEEHGWKEISREEFEADDRNPYPYAFITLEAIR